MENTPIYKLRPAEVYPALETTPQGLSEQDVALRRSLYGANTLVEIKQRHLGSRLAAHLAHPMALVLWGSGALALLAAHPAWAAVIWLLVIVNAVFAFWSEYRAAQVMSSLAKLLPVYARVLRAGREQAALTSELVPGDILILAEGNHIPADARLVEEFGLRTNNATLTGEAVPARKSADASLASGLSELERPNLVFAGTSVVSGTGRAVIFATGMLSQFGRLARLTQEVVDPPSSLQVEILKITRSASLAALGIAVVIFLVGAFDSTLKMDLQTAFLLSLGVFVAIVPEGLPATITLSLAIAGQRLAQQGVLVKKLAIIERVGSVSVICTDKSGTLTQNQMVVREIWVGHQRLSISGIGYEPKGAFTASDGSQLSQMNDLHALLTAAALCNNSRLNAPSAEHPQWSGLGDQTEVALRVAALKAGLDGAVLQAQLPRLHELPFDARRKRMSTIHRTAQGQVAYVKGAPREVLALCTHILIGNEVHLLDGLLRSEILAVNDEYAGGALRVLALAQRELPARTGAYLVERVEQGLTFLGLMAMMDPPRPEVAEAVQACLRAGIRITMITGDYGLTAESLARRIGMLQTSHPLIVTGAELDDLNDQGVAELLSNKQEIIFARMAPEHKLRLVAAFQSLDEVVAVTGDGVNDAPALRKADVGIVMGRVGTDVAKEAADIIITDDNFLGIVHAVAEGRAVYNNLRKFITYIFASNVPEVMPFILRALFGLPLTLTFKQILAIDLGTDLLPALALGIERPEPDIMQRPPRSKNQPIIDRSLLLRSFLGLGLIEAGLCYLGVFLATNFSSRLNLLSDFLPDWLANLLRINADSAPTGDLAITVFLSGVVMAQVGNAFACRTERLRGRTLGWLSNPSLLRAVTIEILLILLMVYFPPLQAFFGHAPIPPAFWIILGAYAPILYLFDWTRKMILRRRYV